MPHTDQEEKLLSDLIVRLNDYVQRNDYSLEYLNTLQDLTIRAGVIIDTDKAGKIAKLISEGRVH